MSEPLRTIVGIAAIIAGGAGGALLGAQASTAWAQLGTVLGAGAGFSLAALLWWRRTT